MLDSVDEPLINLLKNVNKRALVRAIRITTRVAPQLLEQPLDARKSTFMHLVTPSTIWITPIVPRTGDGLYPPHA